jgi:hypothetical protein
MTGCVITCGNNVTFEECRLMGFVPLMMEAIRSSETSLSTRATCRNIQEYGILHSHFHENLKSYIALTGWAL